MQRDNHLSTSSCHHNGFFFTESCRSCENIHINISIYPLSVGGPVILFHVDSGKMFGMRLFVWKTGILWFSQQEAFLSSSRNTWRSSASSRLQFKSSAGWHMTTRRWVCLHNSRWPLHYWADCLHIYATNQSASLRPLMELPPSTLQTLDVHQAHASRRQERERASEWASEGKYADCRSAFTLISKRVNNISSAGIIRRTTNWDNITRAV